VERPNRSWILTGITGLLTVPVLAAQQLLPIPLPWLSVPSSIFLVVALAGIAALIARGRATGWLGYGIGLAAGTLGTLVAIASFTGSMSAIVENWLVSRDVFAINLAFTIALITAAAAIGYATGALVTQRMAGPTPGARRTLLVISLPVVAMAGIALGYPLIVPEPALLAADAPSVTVTVSADGRLEIEPTEFRAGQAIWEIASEFDRPLALVMVAVQDDADLERLIAGDRQGFTFEYAAEAVPGPGSRLKLETPPARYAIYVEEGGEAGEDGVIDPRNPPDPIPIPPKRLVIVAVQP
jgi:hypothetical protein